MLMVGEKFPELKLGAVMGDGTTRNDLPLGGKSDSYTVVFFYPSDFTFVCPTEIVAFDRALDEFKKLKTEVIGVSVDSVHSHAAWRRTPLNDGGVGELRFPLASDLKRELSTPLGILAATGVTYRASYLLDKQGVIRHIVINDLALGRSVSDMLRMVDALSFYEENGDVCPANWQKGEQGMKTTREAAGAHLAKQAA